MMLRHVQRNATKQGKHLCCLPVTNPAQVFPIGHIQYSVLFVLDVPMLAYCLGGLLRLYRQRADVVLGV